MHRTRSFYPLQVLILQLSLFYIEGFAGNPSILL
jgi:hypothetical protein